MLQCNNCTGRSGPRQSHQTITSADLFAQPCRERVRRPKLQPRHPTSSCRRRARRWCRRRTGPGGRDGFELPRGAPRWISSCPRSMLSSNRIDCRPSRPGPSGRAEHVCIHTRVGVKPVLVKTPVRHHLALNWSQSTRCYGGTPHDSYRGAGFAACPRSVAGHPRRGWIGRAGRFRSVHVLVQPTLLGWLRRPIIRNLRGCLACRCPTVLGPNIRVVDVALERNTVAGRRWKAGCPMSRSRGQRARRPG